MSDEVIPAFIFTPEQIDHNPYRSDHALQFMIESLEDLLGALKGHLYIFYGEPEKIVADIIKKLKVDAIFVNQDYTPYSIKRDEKIALVCKKLGAAFHSYEDALLYPVHKTVKANGEPYLIFTPFFRNASRSRPALPQPNRYTNYYTKPISFAEGKNLYKKILPKRFPQVLGGRTEALKILKNLKNLDGTTHLSPHLKFTTCSPREIYYAIRDQLGPHSEFIRSLYWRDFFTAIAFHFPKVFKGAFHSKFDRIKWTYDKALFKKWCEGKTGFPIVDAGMRELNQTGFMPNRVRMIASSFLVKDLHIDWRWGEKYFAQKLTDYDPAVNNGNWQWVASTGCDAQPYFRIFNPWSQAKKFDPDCTYIKRWIPELEDVPPKAIHSGAIENSAYPKPVVDHAKEAKKAVNAYRL
jgi:deoxyribodipyrimidine photo-lyase